LLLDLGSCGPELTELQHLAVNASRRLAMARVELMQSLNPTATRRAARFIDPRVARIKAILRTQIHRQLTLPDLAGETGLSVSRLCYLFKTHTGAPPARYLKRARMERARELLETTFLSVKEISARTGLRDVSHFVRDFEKTYGLSPSRYRIIAGMRELGAGLGGGKAPVCGEPPETIKQAQSQIRNS
jgi:transcriptional regulator GlxA family with amidase domain